MRIKLQLRNPNLVAKTNRALTAISALFLGFTFLSSLITVTYQERKGSSTSACNPFIHPGFLAPLPSGLISYKTYDPSCSVKGYLSTLLSNVPSSPYHMRALPSRNPTDVQELDQKLHNKTVLLIGDSTDRSLLTHFCDLLGKRVETVNQYHPWGKSMLQVPLKHAEIPGHPGTYASKNPGDTPLGHLCYVEEYNFLLATAYHMGADISETFQGKPAWTAPTLFENRMTDLFIPFLDAMNQLRLPSLPPRPTSSPDLTILGSSFWDLARFAQEDAALMRNQVDDLSEHRLLSWRGRHIDMLSSVKKAWPSTVIGWRSMHIPTETEKTSVDWWTGGQKSTDSVSGFDSRCAIKYILGDRGHVRLVSKYADHMSMSIASDGVRDCVERC